MILHLFAIRDVKASAFSGPMPYPAVGVAVRDFTDQINGSDSLLSKHSEDYDLYEIGTFDTDTGTVEGVAPVVVVPGSSLKIVR